RGAFARGRAAAADDDWAGAHEAFRTARDHTTVNPAAQAPDSPAPPAPPRPTSGTSSPQPSPPPPSPESTPSPSANGHSTPAAPGNRPDTPPTSAPDSTEAAHPTAYPANTPPPHPTSPSAPDAPPSPGLSDWVGYAAGRVAESGERWAEAEGLFGGVVGFADAGLRACHARGRAAAEAGAWARALAAMEEAVAERAAVTASHPVPAGTAPATGDADRLPEPAAWLGELRARVYEEAVAAADAGSWEEASAALRLLPDDHEDVARRRRFARGRAAEARGEWTGAAEAYREADHPDAGFRRRYALGRAAVLAGEWGAACEHFAQVPGHVDDFPEPPAPLLLYARGRDAAARDDWKAVVEDFGGLPDSHADGDVGHRRRYARARLAERQDATRPDTWTAVLGHLDGVPDEALGGAVGLLRRKATALHALSLGAETLTLAAAFDRLPPHPLTRTQQTVFLHQLAG
ncbi:hypothetical protein ABTX35_41090, partial [Streptomyces sp. NPDC096080]